MLTPSDAKYLADLVGLRERDPLHYYSAQEAEDVHHLSLLRLIGDSFVTVARGALSHLDLYTICAYIGSWTTNGTGVKPI
jgi:hypothetical protein